MGAPAYCSRSVNFIDTYCFCLFQNGDAYCVYWMETEVDSAAQSSLDASAIGDGVAKWNKVERKQDHFRPVTSSGGW